jgi:hypothetical protein
MAVADASGGSVGEDEDTSAIGGDGWAVKSNGYGVEALPRAEVLAKVKASPVRVIVQVSGSFEECSGAGGTHVYFGVPESWGEKPFVAATLGGHGIGLDDVFAPSNGLGAFPGRHAGPREGRSYVAGVRVGTLHQPKRDSGICLGDLPASDAAIIALAPVRSMSEGLRVLERMR